MTNKKFELSDLDKNIYLEERGVLAERLDFAWSVYTNGGLNRDIRLKAQAFLIYALNITNIENLNDQLILLMNDRLQNKENNPEYIPGKAPTNIPNINKQIILPQKTKNTVNLNKRK